MFCGVLWAPCTYNMVTIIKIGSWRKASTLWFRTTIEEMRVIEMLSYLIAIITDCKTKYIYVHCPWKKLFALTIEKNASIVRSRVIMLKCEDYVIKWENSCLHCCINDSYGSSLWTNCCPLTILNATFQRLCFFRFCLFCFPEYSVNISIYHPTWLSL